MLTVRYYDNGARFQPGRRLSISDRFLLRLLRARDEYDVWAILATGRPIPPIGEMPTRDALLAMLPVMSGPLPWGHRRC